MQTDWSSNLASDNKIPSPIPRCWAFPVESYEWIMNAPNMTSLLVNLIFLCNIIRVLVTKLRATHSNEPSQYSETSLRSRVKKIFAQFCVKVKKRTEVVPPAIPPNRHHDDRIASYEEKGNGDTT
ncbi:calcitonin gene-related peptide type 1 receptor [Trichonephila clavipes]|nr:calcitonin gene-related peptide type 1 receptor [Trichonephila clavipes]